MDLRNCSIFIKPFFAIGRSSVPEVFLGDQLLGGYDEIQALEASGKLDTLLAECVEAPHFPPPLRTPSNEEYLQVSIVNCNRN